MISLLKFTRGKEVINRLELSAVAEMIRRNPDEQRVRNLRLQYQFMKPERLKDGQIAVGSDVNRGAGTNVAAPGQSGINHPCPLRP